MGIYFYVALFVGTLTYLWLYNQEINAPHFYKIRTAIFFALTWPIFSLLALLLTIFKKK